ncbi:transcription factor EMB1444-like isoform X1 [Actinidia eriantha]|uniref:transcription factor EMB1444-like isoform X1 n=1 Tax=Actinidia eriantha TaxID=165200 RepID=UPI0025885170|nr:transcription factor EMB1444-like isoform X1 [Actinidia eriantha]
MGAHLHHALKAFCSDTEWKYAVFWKLKHQARMFVGQVAVTRKRMWIFADKLVTDSCSPFETIVVVAVVPHGVVQLGSLKKKHPLEVKRVLLICSKMSSWIFSPFF